MDGIFLGLMTGVGFAVIYKRLHPKVQVFMQMHPLLTDVVCMVLFYNIMGMTITSHFAVAAMSMMTMAGLHIERHKSDFQFLYDGYETVRSKVSAFLESLKTQAAQMNAAHKAAKLNECVIDVA
jgi:hypothetical protein